MRYRIIINHFIDVCCDIDDPSKNIRLIIIDQLNNTNSLSPDETDDIMLQNERFQRLSPSIMNLLAHMIGIEKIVQNALSNDKTHDN